MKQIAAIQMASGPNVQANLMEAGRLIDEAATQGAELVVLPENFAIMGLEENDKVAIAEVFGQGDIQSFIANVCERYGIWVIAGSVPIRSADIKRPYAAALVFNAEGRCVAGYNKMHLFDVNVSGEDAFTESQTCTAGNKTVVLSTPFGQLGLAVGYDLRFPEHFRMLSEQGAELIVIPSTFTETTGKAHWDSLIRARAIENLSYVVAAGQGGYHVNGRSTYGHSMLVDYWGNVHEVLGKGSGVISFTPDMDALHKTRAAFPVLEHRIR